MSRDKWISKAQPSDEKERETDGMDCFQQCEQIAAIDLIDQITF